MQDILYLKSPNSQNAANDLFGESVEKIREITYGSPIVFKAKDVIFVDGSIVKEKKPLDTKKPEGTFVLITDQDNEHFLKQLASYPSFSHVICKESETFNQEVQSFLRFHTSRKSSDFFGDVNWHEPISLTNSDAKYSIYDQVADYIDENHRVFTEFSDIVTTACSELLSNAFHDAPRDTSTGEPLYPERDKKVELPPPHKVTFQFGSCENEHFWIKVNDTFGTFRKNRLFEALSRAATDRKALVQAKGGAGLGLLMMLNWSSAMYFEFQEDKSTTVYCKFKITRRRKKFDNHTSHLHVILPAS